MKTIIGILLNNSTKLSEKETEYIEKKIFKAKCFFHEIGDMLKLEGNVYFQITHILSEEIHMYKDDIGKLLSIIKPIKNSEIEELKMIPDNESKIVYFKLVN